MKITNWKVVAELIGIAAIVASLIFVGLEMRQQQVLARAELSSASFDYMRSVRQSFSNGQFAESYIKMLRSPESLTDEEIARIPSRSNPIGRTRLFHGLSWRVSRMHVHNE